MNIINFKGERLMMISREEIVKRLIEITSENQVVTDKEVLKQSTADRFRKIEWYFGVYTQPIPAAVVYAESKEDVVNIIEFANENGINVVPRTGASATEGGLETVIENTIVLDGSKMNKILDINTTDMLVTCQCGVPLEVVENQLREQGYTTGHSPQCKPIAQMGGLVATRSIGQFSTLYGGIEDMVVGLEAVFPKKGLIKIKNVPRRAAGPDIRHIVIGNEGALCYITEVTVKIFKYYPENNKFFGYLLDDMKTGFAVLREVMVRGYKPSVARLYDEPDAERHFPQASKGKCVLVLMAEGPAGIVQATSEAIEDIMTTYPQSEKVDPKVIETWFNSLCWGLDVLEKEKMRTINTKNGVTTTEVSANWSCIQQIYERCMERIPNEIPDMTYLAAHSSHSYMNGTNLYFVYRHNIDCKPEEDITKYHLPIQTIIVEETIKAGGSMCHHHGVGKHRAPWIKEEHGSAYPILENLKKSYDPNGIMNKGTIIPIIK
ncbi:FAD-binding oxidoreductase [uncultured Ilyobacter sp.]|uniref:FAD-binding oxidoreductase n=1 Tax=uncultured Ilyobacter sp. TaxID=544433 RepID=UPI0029F56FC5|nr:FAD-binding oxidoreductase [uncultured Ilyobacter sp.]